MEYNDMHMCGLTPKGRETAHISSSVTKDNVTMCVYIRVSSRWYVHKTISIILQELNDSKTFALGRTRRMVPIANGIVRIFEWTNRRYANDSDPESVRARFELFLLNKTPI